MNRCRAAAAALALALLTTLLVIAPAGGAKTSRRTRTVIAPYSHAALAVAISVPVAGDEAAVGYCLPDDPPPMNGGCVRIPIKPSDRMMSIEINDLHQLPVQGMLVSPTGQVLHFVCGKTTAPVVVPNDAYFDLWLVAGTCMDGSGPSLPTMGEVVVRVW